MRDPDSGAGKRGRMETRVNFGGGTDPLDDGVTRPVLPRMSCTWGTTRQLRSMKTGGRTTISVCATGVSSWPGG